MIENNNDYEFTLNPTNSLIYGAFDILKSDAPEDNATNVLSLSAMNMEESYMGSIVNFISSVSNSLTESKINLYRSLKEHSNNSTYVLESFSDYYVQVEAITSKVIKFLNTKTEDFISTMNNYMEETKSITEHKKALTEEIKYYTDDSSEGYNYTIDETIPNIEALDSFNASLFDDLYKPVVNNLSIESIKETIAAIDIEQDLESFRARVLNYNNPINIREFEDKLYRVFRDESSNMIELDYDAKDIRAIAEEWFKKYEVKSALSKDCNNIEKALDSVLKKIEVLTKNNNNMSVSAFTHLMPGDIKVEKIDGKDVDTSGMMMSPEMMVNINIYTKAKIDLMQKYTDIICLVMAAKMDAIKGKIQQDRRVLLSAIDILDNPEGYYDARKTPKASSVDETYLSEAKYSKGFYKAAVKARNGKPLTPKDVAEIVKAGFTPENIKDAIKGGKNLVKNKKNKKAVSEGFFSNRKARKLERERKSKELDEYMKRTEEYFRKIGQEIRPIINKELNKIPYFKGTVFNTNDNYVYYLANPVFLRCTCAYPDILYSNSVDDKEKDKIQREMHKAFDVAFKNLNKNTAIKKYIKDLTFRFIDDGIEIEAHFNNETINKSEEIGAPVSEGFFNKKDNGLDPSMIYSILPGVLDIIDDELQKSNIFARTVSTPKDIIKSVITTNPVFKTKYVYIPFVYGKLIDWGDSEFSNDTQKENTKLIHKQIVTRSKNINNKIKKYGDLKVDLEIDGNEVFVHLYINRDLLD